MKITKIKTKLGELGSPVSTELDAIVERMRSDDTREAAERIRAVAMQARLMMEKGAPRYLLKDADRLPYLLFGATFGKGGLDNPISFTQLLLLDIPCPEGQRQVSDLKKRVQQVPYTVLAFAGVSGVTLKVVVRCQYGDGATPWKSGPDSREMLDAERYLRYRRANYIEDFARRLPTNYSRWPQYFHRWFLAMVAQALNINRDFGNSMVPMLIGSQGIKKSNFCKNILPPSMREYYMDDIKMDNTEQVERVLGRMWLVCIDEYNAKTAREQAKIKRILTEKDVQIRKMRSDQYTMMPRLCSFIATTNDLTPLPSGDGSRRYLCVEVTAEADMSGRIPYKQMYAQAVAELKAPDCLYWFTSEDEREIQAHNSQYQQELPLEQVLASTFEPASDHRKEHLWTVAAIQKELSNRLRASDVPNLTQLGKTLKLMKWPRGGNTGIRGYYLQLRKE